MDYPTMIDANFVDSTHHVSDGIIYCIFVYSEGQGFYASWKCGDCAFEGGSSGTSATIEAAIEGARVNLTPHHNLKHKGQ